MTALITDSRNQLDHYLQIFQLKYNVQKFYNQEKSFVYTLSFCEIKYNIL